MDLIQGRTISPREVILSTLGLFNIFYQLILMANDLLIFLWSELYFIDKVHATLSFMLLFTVFSSFWFTACLCGFYYVNIVSFKSPLFMQLKHNMSEVVNWMLSLSTLIALIISIPIPWNISKLTTYSVPTNTSVEEVTSPIRPQYLLIASVFGCCIPLVLVGTADAIVLRSLFTNARLLHRNAGGMSVQSVDASIAAARTITSLLLLYLCFYLAVISLLLNIVLLGSTWFPLCVSVIYSYSPIQSVILILGSPKLKGASLKLFARLMGQLYNT
ncbi:taste receptor type 2 member 40-like [Mantella aurantiaca]